MRQNWVKLNNKLKLTIVGGLTVSASLVSTLNFINFTGSSNSLLAQNHFGREQYGNQKGNGNSQGGRDTYSTNNSPTYNRNRNNHTDNRRDQRQYKSNTNHCESSRGASCGDGNTLNNRF